MKKLNEKIEQLTFLMQSQKSNAEHYFGTANDDATGHYWRNAARDTEQKIKQLEDEKAIITKWKNAEVENDSSATLDELRSDIRDLGDEIHNEIDHGECFYDKNALEEFVSTLNTLEIKTLRYWAANQESSES